MGCRTLPIVAPHPCPGTDWRKGLVKTSVTATLGGPPFGGRVSASHGPQRRGLSLPELAPRWSSGLWLWTQQSPNQRLQLSNCLLFLFWPHSLWGLSSLTRDRTCAPTLGVWSPNHWATREVPSNSFLSTRDDPVPPTRHLLTLQPAVEEARLVARPCHGGQRGSEGLTELSQHRGSNTSVHSPRTRQGPLTHTVPEWVLETAHRAALISQET